MEFGIFSDEGCLERDFYSREEAERVLSERYPDDGAHVGECCPDHPEEERETCELCNADDEDES